jgi:hypothetical protein
MHKRYNDNRGIHMSGLIIGTLLVLLGISMLFKAVFGFDIPFVRLFFAGFLIYLGISMIIEKPLFKYHHSSTYQGPKGHVYIDPTKVIDIKFAKRVLYQSDLLPETKVFINTAFAKTILKLDPAIPTQIRANAVSSSVTLPDGNMVSFGDIVFNTHGQVQPQMVIEAKVLFASFEIEYQ